MATKPLPPGTPAPQSGQYIPVGPRGGRIGNTEVSSTQGKPLPPRPVSGQGYILVDPTKHKGK